jgi:hypothetical protein
MMVPPRPQYQTPIVFPQVSEGVELLDAMHIQDEDDVPDDVHIDNPPTTNNNFAATICKSFVSDLLKNVIVYLCNIKYRILKPGKRLTYPA